MDRANIVLIMADELKATALSLYGNERLRVPALERLAAGGTLFSNAFAAIPLCTPSRCSLFTGRHNHALGVYRNGEGMRETERTLVHVLKQAGYSAHLIGKDHCFTTSQQEELFDSYQPAGHAGVSVAGRSDLDEVGRWFEDQAQTLFRAPWGTAVTPFPPEQCPSAVLTDLAIDFLQSQEGRERRGPFFLWLSYPDPHTPLQVPRPYADSVPAAEVELPPEVEDELAGKTAQQRLAHLMFACEGADDDVKRAAISTYYGMIRFLDDQIGRVLGLLDDRRHLANTIVVFVSDHGCYLAEHGLIRKSLAFYDCLLRVPLIIRHPGKIPSGRTCSGLVSLVDLMPTLLELAGQEIPPAVHGRSRAQRITTGEPEHEARDADAIFAEAGLPGTPPRLEQLSDIPQHPFDGSYLPWGGRDEAWLGRGKMVRTRRWKLAVYETGEGELYDLRNDPWELSNLFDDPRHASTVRRLSTRLMEWLIATEA